MRPTVDAIIENGEGRIVLIYRANHPKGWALPGGHVDGDETFREAAIREVEEETGLRIDIIDVNPFTGELGVYDDPKRDPRGRTMGVVFVAKSIGGILKAATDAKEARWFSPAEALKLEMCFDHKRILEDYIALKKSQSG